MNDIATSSDMRGQSYINDIANNISTIHNTDTFTSHRYHTMNCIIYDMISDKLNEFTNYARDHGYNTIESVIDNIHIDTELNDHLSTFNNFIQLFGYDCINDSSLLTDLMEFELTDPRRECNSCGNHIADRIYNVCDICHKSYHVGCFDDHGCAEY